MNSTPRMIPQGRTTIHGKDFLTFPPTADDLNNAIDITDYVSVDGVLIPKNHKTFGEVFDYYSAVTGLPGEEISRILGTADWLNPPPSAPIIGNTSKRYPTSTPPWKRGKR